MMNCTWDLNILNNGDFETKSFNSYEDLVDYIQKNSKKTKLDKQTDIVYSRDLSQSEASDLLQQIKHESKLMRSKYSKKIDEFYIRPEDDKYIDVYEFVQSGLQQDQVTPFTTDYSTDEYKARTIPKLVDQGMTPTQAEQVVQNEIDKWERIEDRAYYLHTLINAYFNGKQDLISLRDFMRSEFPIHLHSEYNDVILTKLIQQLNQIKSFLFRQHGSDAKMYSNIGITCDLNNSENKLYMNLDVIMIDNQGTPHVYMFKTSGKHETEQAKVKLRKRDYYLGTARQILAQKGFNVKNTTLSIVPMQIFEDDSNKLLDVTIDTQPIDRRSVPDSHLQYKFGKIWKDLNTYIPVTLNEQQFQGSIYNSVIDKLDSLFPTKNIKHDSRSKKITNFIKNNVIESTVSGYTWQWTDKHGKIYRVKENSPKETNSELREAVTKYLDKLQDENIQGLSYFLDGIRKSINNGMPLMSIINGSGGGRLNIVLGKYINGDWEYKQLPKLEELGIACIQNKTTGQIDFIQLTYEYDLSRLINLGLGTSILGSFKKDNQLPLDNIMKATNGNINFIKLLLALEECSEELEGEKIGELKVMNLNSGETLNIQSEQLFTNYKALLKTAGITSSNINKIQQNKISDLEILKNQIANIISNLSISKTALLVNSLYDLETIHSTNKQAIAEACLKIKKELEEQYKNLLSGTYTQMLEKARDRESNEILNLYRLVVQTYLYSTNQFYEVQQMQTAGTGKSNTFLNGQLFATADVLPYKNEANVTRSCLTTFQKIRREFTSFKERFFEKDVKKMWNEKGYSQGQNITLGNQRNIYRNLFRETDGKLNPNLMFKDENDPTLSQVEKEFLKKVLWIINRRRFKLETYSESSDVVKEEKEKAGEKWYWVPLQEASGGSKINSEYIEDTIRQEVRDVISFGKTAKENFRRNEANVYTEAEFDQLKKLELRNEVFVRYELSDNSQEERTKLLATRPLGFWETNVENIVLEYELTYLRKRNLDQIMPYIAATKFLIEAWGNDAQIDTKVNIEYLDNYVKQAIHNVTLLSDQENEYVHLVRKAKSAASYAMIVGNAVAPIRDTLEGIWKGIGIFVGNTWGKDKGFNKSEFMKAYQIVLSDSLDGFSGVTVLEALNQRFGISDMDYQQLSKKSKSGKVGLFNFRDKLWWTTTAGDYTNRMVILIAKMLHDGCFEACTYKGGFKYDMRKDKRFGNDPQHLTGEKRGLYLSMLREFNESGYNLKDGDLLPEPYTPQEIITLKSFSDRLYGYYDHDLKIQAEKHALGSLFLQFCTYLTANKTQWFLSPDQYETNVRQQAVNSEGKPLYLKRVLDDNGDPQFEVTDEVTTEPYYIIKKSYMEGIYYTLRDFCRDVKSLGFSGAVHNVKDCEVKQQNLRLLAYKLTMWLIIGAIVKSLLSMWKEHRKKDKSPYTISRALQDEGFDLFYRAMNGSLATFNLIDQFGGKVVDSEPPAFAVATNMVNSTFKFGKNMIKGNEFGESLDSWIHANSAAYRSVHELVKGVKKARAAINNSAE